MHTGVRCCMLEHSLRHSKHHQLNSIVCCAVDDEVSDDVDEAVRAIAAVKKVDVTVCPA